MAKHYPHGRLKALLKIFIIILFICVVTCLIIYIKRTQK